MKVIVRYFAAARETVGTETETVDVAPGTTVGALRTRLEGRHPPLADMRLRFAVGQAFAEETRELAEDDEVALIPPVSGG